ncbi:MAG: 50S ribosomal protein L18 [Vampirovibrio sp.]|nr:50S ribosomal protein L18 [Vampirovibrio sp.]
MSAKTSAKKYRTRNRHYRLRRKISGTTECPRLAVYRSGKHIYAQIIDDLQGVTLAAASSIDKDLKSGGLKSGANIDAAKQVGDLIGRRAKDKGLSVVVFDRGGNRYHGRIAALADAARECGLQF